MGRVKKYRYNGLDPQAIPRVFGTGPTLEIAEARCKNEALDYVRSRPDTGPLDKWTFKEIKWRNGKWVE